MFVLLVSLIAAAFHSDKHGVRSEQIQEAHSLTVEACDRLVIGTRDSATRDRLLRERPVPGLTRCIEALRASELSRTHQEQLKDAVSDSQNTIHAAKKQSPRKRKQGRRNCRHESKQVNTRKQVQSNASSVAQTILTIELNVQLPVRLALSVANKATLLLSVRKRIGFQVDQPTRYITQVQHQDMQKGASQHVNHYLCH